jgi:glutamine synthetase
MYPHVQAFDAATNPYIGVAAILIAGHLGLVHHKDNPTPLPEPCQVDPKVCAYLFIYLLFCALGWGC